MKQFSITIPLSLDEFHKGVKFVDYLIDFDLSTQSQQKVEIVSQTPYIKMYFLYKYLPTFIQQLTGQRQLQVQERKSKSENGESRQFNVVQFPGLEITVTSSTQQGDRMKYESLDVINEPLDYFKGYEKDVERKMKENFGIQEFNNWKRFCPNLITCNITIELRVSYGDESDVVEQYLSDLGRKYVVYFYKSLLLTYKNWNNLTDSEIFRMSKQVLISQQSQMFKLNTFPHNIFNLQDMLNKTKFNELKKVHLSKYTKSQSQFGTPSRVSQSGDQMFRSSPIAQPYQLLNKSQEFVKKNLLKKKAGQIYKRGDGPIDYNWNQRYIVLDGETLIYFKDKFDKVPRGVINLRESYISPIQRLEDREHGFYIEIESQNKQFYFSGETVEESELWREEITQATVRSAPQTSNEKRRSFNNFATNTYLLTDGIPQQLQKYPVINQLDQLQNEWQFRKFRNGVKIYDKPYQVQKHSNKLKYLFPLISLIFVVLGYLFDRYSIYAYALAVITLSGMLIKKKSKQQQQVYARLVFDIDPTKAFDVIKNTQFKKILDINIVSITKLKKEDMLEFTKHATYQFIVHPIRQNEKVVKPVTITMNLTRTKFIIKDQHSYVVDISTSQDNKLLIIEIFEVQRINKVSGKGILNYYCEITSNKMALTDFDKYLYHKAENLSLISQTIDELRFHQFQQSIVNELSVVQDTLQHTSSLRGSQVMENGHKLKGFEETIQLINSLKNNSCSNRGKKLEERKPGYRKFKEGGVECFNREEIRAQDGLVLDLMRSFGKQLMEGKNIISVSLPVRIFESRSMIERICDWWAFIPIYLDIASQTTEHTERFKLVVTMVLAGLYNGARQKKPFNPILGETFTGSWQNGTEIYVEHTSHHPPISHFYVVDSKRKYKFYGHYEYQAALRYNAVIGHQIGDNVIQFADGQKITYQMPQARVSGLLFGARVQEWYNVVKFTDVQNGLVCEIKFSEGAGMLIGRNAKPTDCFEGTLLHLNRVVSKVEGSWLDTIQWDNIKYWDLEQIDPATLLKCENPLPSDCRFRTDLIELANNDLENAQEEKTRLEVLQRRDRKLRQDYKQKQKTN